MEEKREMELKQRVIISGLEIPFWDLVWFMVKLTLASIPALLILWIFFAVFGMLFTGAASFFAAPPMP